MGCRRAHLNTSGDHTPISLSGPVALAASMISIMPAVLTDSELQPVHLAGTARPVPRLFVDAVSSWKASNVARRRAPAPPCGAAVGAPNGRSVMQYGALASTQPVISVSPRSSANVGSGRIHFQWRSRHNTGHPRRPKRNASKLRPSDRHARFGPQSR